MNNTIIIVEYHYVMCCVFALQIYNIFFSVCVSADGFEELRRLGLLRYNAGRDIEIYDYYLSEVDITGSRMQAQTNCAMRYNLSEKAIQVIVYGFESRLRGV